MTSVLVTVLYILACVALFAVAILIHELGHFLVALKLGLKVEAFSIGFGPAVWHRKFGEVDFRIAPIPLGGYVLIPDIDPEGTQALEGGSRDASRMPIAPWKEIAVAVAGPGMNIVLAVVLACVLSLVPTARFGETLPLVTDVLPEGPAAKAGMQVGDFVLSVGSRPISTWTDMTTEVQIAGGRPTVFRVRRGGTQELELEITPVRNEVTGAWYILAASTNSVGAAGWMPSRNPIRQLAWDAGSIFRVLKGLVTPKDAKSTAGALGGPVMIAEAIYRSLRHDVWDGLGFLRFLNVNLAVLNLLPIPVLDGGLIFFSLVALLVRRRLPAAFVKYLTLAFMVLLMGLMGLLILRDSYRSYRIHTYDPDAAGNAASNTVDEATSDQSR